MRHTHVNKVRIVRLEFLILADKAEAIGGKLYLMGGGFDRVWMTAIPGPAQFDVAVGVLVGYGETNQQHSFELRCEDAAGNVVVEAPRGAIEVGRPPGMAAGSEQRALLVFGGPFAFREPGEYAWVLALDGQRQSPTRFCVERATVSAPGTPQR
jgi:Family of unknown function (DUF6941)